MADINEAMLMTELRRLCAERSDFKCERNFVFHSLNEVLPDFNLTTLVLKINASREATVLVSKTYQDSFMSAIELFSTNIPLFFPFQEGKWMPSYAADYLHRPGVVLYSNETQLAESIFEMDIQLHVRFMALWNHKFRVLMTRTWAILLRRAFPGIENGTYVRPNTSLVSLEEAWLQAVGLPLDASTTERTCSPPDEIISVSPHAV